MDRQQLTRFRVKLCCAMAVVILGAAAIPVALLQRPATPVEWLTNLPKARHLSRDEGKPILIDFFATWCGPCKMMDRDVYSNCKVADVLQHFICVRLDVDLHPDEAQQFGVSGIPHMFVLDNAGEPVTDQIGYTGAADGLQIIRDAYAATQRGHTVASAAN